MNSLRRRLAVVLTAVVVATIATASPAGADVTTSSARALTVTTALGVGLATTDVTSTSDGVTPHSDSATSLVSALGSQSILSAGVLVAATRAETDGSSAACAGAVGSGGTIAIGPTGNCVVTVGTPGQLVFSLVPGVTVEADAIVSSCTAHTNGTVTTTTELVGASIESFLSSTSLAASPAPNTSAGIVGVLGVDMHSTSTPAGPGTVAVTALELSAIGSLAAATVGSVSCGPNLVTVPTPVVPLAVVPLLGAGMLGGAFAAKRRVTP